jgi:23S rRNA pseudouridine2605 synthase
MNNDSSTLETQNKGIRLSKQVSLISKFSRNEAEKLINSGRITVNGSVNKSATSYVKPSDSIKIEGAKTLEKTDKLIKIIALNKPRGFVVTRKDEKNRKTIYSFLPHEFSNYIYVGRLDINSEGLILLTNSGSLAHELEDPINEFEREYEVRVFGYVTPDKINRMIKGVSIDGLHYKAKSVEIKKRKTDDSKNTWLNVVLTSGKNREVRKLMEFFNLTVNRLVRIRYAHFSLNSIPLGAFMEIHRTKTEKVILSVQDKCQKILTL